MKSRTFLWILIVISLVALIGSGAGLLWYYQLPDAQQVAQKPDRPEVEPPVLPEPAPPEEEQPAEPAPPEPSVDPEPEPVPEPAPEQTRSPGEDELEQKDFYYWIITGVYTAHEDAEALVSELDSYDLPARIHVQGGQYEVRVGPYDAVEEAEFTASRVETLDFIETVRIKIILNR
jgi:cell division protein FtsN